MKKIKQDLLKATIVVSAVLTVSAFILGFGSYIAQAWVEPSGPPGTEEVAAPLNVSASWQEKEGMLQLDPAKISGVNDQNSLSVFAQNLEHSAIYAEQNFVTCSPTAYCWSGYFSGNFAIDGDIYVTGTQYVGKPIPTSRGGKLRGPAGEDIVTTFNGSILIENDNRDANVCLNGNSDAECIKSFTPTAFQCNRDDASCGVDAQTTCQAKCQNATDPGAGFCGSAWDDSGTLQNYTCDSTAKASGTIRCNCLRFE
jgi:hypothetical protein